MQQHHQTLITLKISRGLVTQKSKAVDKRQYFRLKYQFYQVLERPRCFKGRFALTVNMTRNLGYRKSTHDNSRKVGLAKQAQKLKIHSLLGAVYSIFHSFFWKKKMEAIGQKQNEADDIAEVIDSKQNLRIPIKGCENIKDMKEGCSLI